MGSEGTLPCPICDVGEEHCKCQKRAIFAEGAMQRIRGKREGRTEMARKAADMVDKTFESIMALGYHQTAPTGHSILLENSLKEFVRAFRAIAEAEEKT